MYKCRNCFRWRVHLERNPSWALISGRILDQPFHLWALMIQKYVRKKLPDISRHGTWFFHFKKCGKAAVSSTKLEENRLRSNVLSCVCFFFIREVCANQWILEEHCTIRVETSDLNKQYASEYKFALESSLIRSKSKRVYWNLYEAVIDLFLAHCETRIDELPQTLIY